MSATAKGRLFRLTVPMGAAALTWVSAAAMGDVTKDRCVDAHGRAQVLRREGKFAASREQLRVCAATACPSMVRDDCTKRLDDLEAAQPTIVFEVKDANGADVSAVAVTVDGQPLVARLAGTALPIDAGEHVFTFEVEGQAPVSKKLVIHEGDKGRLERIVVGQASSPPPVPASSPAPTPSPAPVHAPQEATGTARFEVSPSETASTGGGPGFQRVLGLVASGVGVAGLAVGSAFGLMAISQKNDQTTDCGSGPGCKNYDQAVSAHSNATTDSTISTTAFVAGAAFLVGGVALYLTASHGSEHPSGIAISLIPSVAHEGGTLSMRGSF